MGGPHAPKRGSLAYLPKKRARSLNPTIKYWPQIDYVGVKPLGFAGYKAGMTHVYYIDTYRHSPYYGQEVFAPVTVIETPPLKVIGIVGYAIDHTHNRLYAFKTVYASNVPEYVKRRIVTFSSSNWQENLDELTSNLDKIRIIRLLTSTQPILSGFGKKTPEVFEIQLGGQSTIEEKIKYAINKLGQDLSVREVFKPGDVVDVIAVTKGKGFQSAVKRWGIKLLSHKARKSRRKVGKLGPWHPAATRYTVPQAGQLGFHRRTVYNIKILDIRKPEEFQKPLSFRRYGQLKSEFLIVKGSIPGPAKRLIKMRFHVRPIEPAYLEPVKITYIAV